MKIFFYLFFCFNIIFAYSYESLKNRPNSLAKDYYLYRLFEDNKLKSLSKKDIYHFGSKMQKAYEEINPAKPFEERYKECFKSQNIFKMSSKCQKIRLKSSYFISKLNNQDKIKLAKKYQNTDKSLSNKLLALASKDPLAYAIKHEDIDNFLLFIKNQDRLLNSSYLEKLIKIKKTQRFFSKIIIEQSHPLLRSSLLKISPNYKADEKLAFYLGVNAVSKGHEKKALSFFKNASLIAKHASSRDNAIFWCYLLSKDKAYLQSLVNSKSLNIYSLYARELLALSPPATITPKPKGFKKDINMQDPFLWQSIFKKIKSLPPQRLADFAKAFYFENTLAIYSFIMGRVDKNFYFIMPNYELLKAYDIQRRALILAIARQESLFIPAAISTSYALGTMQFMPFLARHTAKELGLKNFDQDQLFDQKLAYKFANHHLNYLEEHLKHPLFIAYAYNGGIGFTTRMLAKKHMFSQGKYQPFLSMELVPYEQSRAYAKKVLANYFIYLKLLNKELKISELLKSLPGLKNSLK